jgi:COP9 signalosome complex subunit 6
VRLVYTKPQLELVGWAALVPETGPTDAYLAIQKYLMNNFSDSIILVALHPEKITNPAGGKLPITIYDSTLGTQEQAKSTGEDETMRDGDVDVPASDRNAKAELRFHELPYSIETGEAEMIGMQFVHRGAANASASAPAGKATTGESDSKGKGKARLEPEAEAKVPLADSAVLTSEESDLIAALTSKRNAILMLKKRIELFITYLQRLPSDGAISEHVNNAVGAVQELASLQPTAPSNTILRAIQALKTNLTLITPTNSLALQPAAQEPQVSQTRAQSTFDTEMLREANDVHLVSLLRDVLQSLDEVREVGKQFSVVDGARSAHRARMVGDDGGRLLGASNPGDLAHILH